MYTDLRDILEVSNTWMFTSLFIILTATCTIAPFKHDSETNSGSCHSDQAEI